LERLSRRSCTSAVDFVLSPGTDAAVDERCRRDWADIFCSSPVSK
jgi:hypothetical protein